MTLARHTCSHLVHFLLVIACDHLSANVFFISVCINRPVMSQTRAETPLARNLVRYYRGNVFFSYKKLDYKRNCFVLNLSF